MERRSILDVARYKKIPRSGFSNSNNRFPLRNDQSGIELLSIKAILHKERESETVPFFIARIQHMIHLKDRFLYSKNSTGIFTNSL